MKGLFSYDSGIMSFLGKMADLIILNFVAMICCIPIITAGASLTAAHYVALKVRRGEGYVLSNFWKSFKENLKQSTVMWMLFLIHLLLAIFSTMILSGGSGTFNSVMQGIIFAALLFSAFIFLWALPLQSKFVNTIGGTIKNAFVLSFKHVFRTVYMLIVCVLPILLLFLLSVRWWSLLILFGISLPTYLCAIMYDKIFEKYEDAILAEQNGEVQADENGEVLEIEEKVE